MNKPSNELPCVTNYATFSAYTQLRYVSKRRIRTLRARHRARGEPFHWRPVHYTKTRSTCEDGRCKSDLQASPFFSWLMPIPLCAATDVCRVQ